MSRKVIAAVGIVGALGAAAVSIGAGIPRRDLMVLLALAGMASLATGAVGGYALRLLRRRSLGLQSMMVAITVVATVAAGASTAATQMFISSHDLKALFVILFAAGTIGIVVALLLGHRATSSIRVLSAAADRIGSGGRLERVDPSLHGEFAALGVALRDMSDRLSESADRERALDVSRRELVAWVSHDLRTPLAGIRAMAEALEDGVVDDSLTVAKYYGELRREADRLSGLVDDLFELSRINAGTLRLQIERVSLGDFVSDALAASAGVARAKGISLSGRLTTERREVALSTPEMSRAIRNLMENAIRHTPSDGSIYVEAGVEADHAFLSVVDSCGGIPATDIERVFDVAYRGESARSPAQDTGAGLGLAIARGIVEAHQGEIAVVNEQDGCRFTVKLPISQPAR